MISRFFPAGGKDSGSTSHEKPDGSSLWQQFKLDSLKESFKQRTSRGRSGISSLFSRNRQSESDESHVTPPYVAADQDFENNEEKEDTLPQTLKQPHYVQDIEYLKPFASNHFGGENVVSVMYRLAHLAKIRLLRRMRTELMTDNAMAIPDIMLNGGAAFHTAWTTVATGDVLGDVFGAEHASGSKRPRTLELQLVAMATRAAIVNAIFDRIVYMAQRKRLGNHKRFAAAGDFNRMPSLPEGLAGQLNFTERADSIHYASSAANATAAYSAGGGSGDPATTLDAILICGPRQTGKSHVMFHLAARMAAEQRVGVVYVGNGADLLLDGSDADRAKYARFVEHVAAAFSEYAQINEMVQTWYKATGIGTDLRELRERTTELLAEVRRLCEKEPGGITPVFFIDAFEAMADAQVFGTIVTPRELTHVHGAVVVLSAGDMGDHQNALKRMALSTCTVAVALSEHDAANVVVATHGQLRMTRAVLRRLHDAAGSHMLDFVRLLDECAAGDEGAHVTAAAAQRAIDAYEVRRTLRLTDMHARFVRRRLDTALDGMPRSQIEFAGAAGKEVAMTTPGLATERRSVMRTPFMLYHNLALKPGAVLDAQFLIEDAAVPAAAAAAAAAGDDDGAAARAHSSLHVTCHPPAAVAAMYRLHFGGGPVLRQFAWLLSDARYKFEVDAPVRARLFDLLLLETQRLAAQATHPLTHQVWPVALNFDAATAHDHRRWGVARSPATCATFDDTVRLVADHIRATRARRPPHVPVAMTVAEMRTTLVVYLPCLNFSTWPDRAIAIDKCFPGAFMLAITRVDLRGRAADECVYELTWIASDPLCAVGSDELISVVTASDAAAGHGKVVAAQPSQQAQAQAQDEAAADILDSYRSPRDTQNYDQLYGVAQSWSAKAIRIFPALRDMCLAALPSDVLRHVRMLALADANRATAIVDEAQLVRLEPRLAAFSTEGSQDIGLIKTNALSAVHQQISAYI
ncbi:hypothetical protein LPJ53_005416 [Coemansia erecta]|uniref:Uncharacterized protein n=1 Tax=Coemansia erecta TaxID=147472 RepID=A0A9W7XXN5_9FUNG|nr:hypothetical protein LPJ53_005416 [Coemansia erecta]